LSWLEAVVLAMEHDGFQRVVAGSLDI